MYRYNYELEILLEWEPNQENKKANLCVLL